MCDAETSKQLRIKLGSVKRMKKEYDYYLKEEIQHRDKIAKMESENADHHDIKQVQECLNETLTVLPDTRARLEKYLLEFVKLMTAFVAASLMESATAFLMASASVSSASPEGCS